MAQNYTLMARKNLLKPDETPKYYAVARKGCGQFIGLLPAHADGQLLTPKGN